MARFLTTIASTSALVVFATGWLPDCGHFLAHGLALVSAMVLGALLDREYHE
jgi:hypothetical protein